MKRLHKKIGVGVLVAGLLLGGGALSKVSVAHADSDRLDAKQESVSRIVNAYEGRDINGKSISVLDSHDMRDGREGIKLSKGSYYISKFLEDDMQARRCLEDLKEIIKQAPSRSFIKLCFPSYAYEIVFIVL